VTEWFAKPPVARIALIAVALWALGQLVAISGVGAETSGDATTTLVVAAVVTLAALISSVAGFAFAALAGSAFAYLGFDAVSTVHTIVLCSTAIQLYAVWKIRAAIRWISLWPMLTAGAATVPFGVWMLLHVDDSVYPVALGVFLTAYGCYAVLRRDSWVVRGSAWRDAVAGALGGLAGGMAGLPGSFVTVWCSMRGWDKLRQRAVYQPFILLMQIATLACLRWQTSIKMQEDGLCFVPFALLGGIAGFALFQRLTHRQFHAAVSALLMASGIGLLSRAL